MAEKRPLFAQQVKEQHHKQEVEVWFQDEARIGQQGTLTRLRATRGSQPTAVRQTEYEWVHLFASINAQTGESAALVSPAVNTAYMNAHLDHISRQVGRDRHATLVLDCAGWHMAKALKVPANITLFHLPPYSPELNAAERVWAYLRQHYLSNRIFRDYDELFDQTISAWNRLSQERLRSPCATCWVKRMN